MKGGSDSPLAVVIVLVLLALYALGLYLQPAICPHPVYAQGISKTLSCDGHVALETPAPEVKR